ncbi:MAG: chemotaxis protein CheW [Coriobacteriia bacterium]|nr:chemotaxis protein CheW [Coriobacteriia bacterium]
MDELLITEQRQYVLFRLRSEEYGLAIKRVQSIIRYEAATPVPRAPAGVDGVINLRGQVIPLVDLGRVLLGEPLVPTQASRIIVVESGVGSVGLAVDVVYEVASIAVADVKPAPAAALGAETSEAFEGVVSHGDRLVILLDADKALPKPVFMSGGQLQEDGADV